MLQIPAEDGAAILRARVGGDPGTLPRQSAILTPQ